MFESVQIGRCKGTVAPNKNVPSRVLGDDHERIVTFASYKTIFFLYVEYEYNQVET